MKNNQKNIRYDITHMCCLNNNAMKNHYLLIQISDIMRQLLEHGSVAIKAWNKRNIFKNIRIFSMRTSNT